MACGRRLIESLVSRLPELQASHVVQLEVRMTVEQAEAWLQSLPVLVPDLSCVSPGIIGSSGERPCGSACTGGCARDPLDACDSVGAESLEQVW